MFCGSTCSGAPRAARGGRSPCSSVLWAAGGGRLDGPDTVSLDDPAKGVAPGQTVVVYDGDDVVLGGDHSRRRDLAAEGRPGARGGICPMV